LVYFPPHTAVYETYPFARSSSRSSFSDIVKDSLNEVVQDNFNDPVNEGITHAAPRYNTLQHTATHSNTFNDVVKDGFNDAVDTCPHTTLVSDASEADESRASTHSMSTAITIAACSARGGGVNQESERASEREALSPLLVK